MSEFKNHYEEILHVSNDGVFSWAPDAQALIEAIEDGSFKHVILRLWKSEQKRDLLSALLNLHPTLDVQALQYDIAIARERGRQ